jgi:hypothetical protein
MTATADYEQALALIRRLDRPTQARLVAQVVQELAHQVPASAPRVSDPRATLAEIREHFAKLGPVSPSAGEQLDLDRQHRADLLEGKIRE